MQHAPYCRQNMSAIYVILVDGIFLTQASDFFAYVRNRFFAPVYHVGYAGCDRVHVLGLHTPCGSGGCSQSYAGGDKWLLRIEGNGILVDGDMRCVEQFLYLFARLAL